MKTPIDAYHYTFYFYCSNKCCLKFSYLYLLLVLFPITLRAQDDQAIYYSKKYLSLNERSLTKYVKRIERQQKQLLNRLTRKERKLARQLKKNDSAAYVRYQEQGLSYDSIARLLKPDSNTLAANTVNKGNKTIDSLKKVQAFLQSGLEPLAMAGNSGNNLDNLQAQLNYQQYINGLIDQRDKSLKGMISGTSTTIPALKGLEKELFYGKSKMKVWKQVANEPSKAEELALEYLQGSKDFSFSDVNSQHEAMSMQNATSEADLEKMGFQTKRQMNEQLQKQFGSSLGNMQQKLGSELSEWQSKTHDVVNEVKSRQQELKSVKKDISQTRQSLKKTRNTHKTSFKVNPMRGLPFWKRIEKGYNFQTTRATPDGKRPAMLELSATAGFKHTPKLSYGIGLATAIGLGQDWSHLHLSFEGVGARSYAKYEMAFGISAYAGYERFFKYEPSKEQQGDNTQFNYNQHNTSTYSEAVLLGLSKRYRINSKWNGAIQVLYDVWWKEKGMNSPVVIRFATLSKN